MCDYSLAGIPNRLATEGEQLMVFRFPTGALGLTSPNASPWRFWSRQTPAVCVPPGARLVLNDIPKDLQRQFDVQATEEVTFVQLSAEAYEYRDAVQFRNGRQVLLQWLRCGQQVEFLSLWSGESREEELGLASARSALEGLALTMPKGSSFACVTCASRPQTVTVIPCAPRVHRLPSVLAA